MTTQKCPLIRRAMLMFTMLTFSLAVPVQAGNPAIPYVAYLAKAGYESWTTWRTFQLKTASEKAIANWEQLTCNPGDEACNNLLTNKLIQKNLWNSDPSVTADQLVRAFPAESLLFGAYQSILLGTDGLTLIFIPFASTSGLLCIQGINVLTAVVALSTILVFGGNNDIRKSSDVIQQAVTVANEGHAQNVTLPYIKLYEFEELQAKVNTDATAAVVIAGLSPVLSILCIYAIGAL